MFNQSAKQALAILAASVIIFWIFKPTYNKEDEDDDFEGELVLNKQKYVKPAITEDSLQQNPKAQNAYDALNIYIDAHNEGKSLEFKKDLNNELKKVYGVYILEKKDGTLEAKDLKNKLILLA